MCAHSLLFPRARVRAALLHFERWRAATCVCLFCAQMWEEERKKDPNVKKHHILENETLFQMAKQAPISLDELSEMPRMSGACLSSVDPTSLDRALTLVLCARSRQVEEGAAAADPADSRVPAHAQDPGRRVRAASRAEGGRRYATLPGDTPGCVVRPCLCVGYLLTMHQPGPGTSSGAGAGSGSGSSSGSSGGGSRASKGTGGWGGSTWASSSAAASAASAAAPPARSSSGSAGAAGAGRQQ